MNEISYILHSTKAQIETKCDRRPVNTNHFMYIESMIIIETENGEH